MCLFIIRLKYVHLILYPSSYPPAIPVTYIISMMNSLLSMQITISLLLNMLSLLNHVLKKQSNRITITTFDHFQKTEQTVYIDRYNIAR
jgi:hypothetical protein